MIVLEKASFLSQVYIILLWLYYILVFECGWLLCTFNLNIDEARLLAGNWFHYM